MWFIGVEVEQETSAPPPKKNPGSAPVYEDYTELPKCHYPIIRTSDELGFWKTAHLPLH